MARTPGSPVSWLLGYASRLRHPQLFLVTLGLFAFDLVFPDMIPLADEILLGLLSLLLGTWKASASGKPEDGDRMEKPPEKDVTPGRRR